MVIILVWGAGHLIYYIIQYNFIHWVGHKNKISRIDIIKKMKKDGPPQTVMRHKPTNSWQRYSHLKFQNNMDFEIKIPKFEYPNITLFHFLLLFLNFQSIYWINMFNIIIPNIMYLIYRKQYYIIVKRWEIRILKLPGPGRVMCIQKYRIYDGIRRSV